ncbi:MAG: BMP family ABC transporter substrate-binding protein [Chloroflexi bacterium]|nr:BMP family ABC transporter substrate-binding protein [Chloroflexota bacterium]
MVRKLFLISALLALLLLAACSPSTPTPPTAAKPFTFGVVLVGPKDDHGWSEAHYNAGLYLEKKLPGSKMVWLDKVNPADRKGTTLEQVIDDMVKQGAKLIFTTSDDFKDDSRAYAQKHADVTIMHISGDDVLTKKNPPNLGNYMGRMEYGKMIAGCAAALTSQTGKIGYLGPLINDETRRLAASVFLGAKYCWTTVRAKPAADLKFEVRWIGFWFNIPGVTLDPTKVSNDFYNGGFDVVLSGIDTTQALVQAGEAAKAGKKVWAIPYDFRDACNEAASVCLGVPYFNWGPGYLKLANAYNAKTWKPEFEWLAPDWKDINNADTSPVGWVPGPALAADNKTKVDAFIKGLADGSIDLWKGELKLQDGSVYLKAGEKATDNQIWFLPQLLQGMDGASK